MRVLSFFSSPQQTNNTSILAWSYSCGFQRMPLSVLSDRRNLLCTHAFPAASLGAIWTPGEGGLLLVHTWGLLTWKDKIPRWQLTLITLWQCVLLSITFVFTKRKKNDETLFEVTWNVSEHAGLSLHPLRTMFLYRNSKTHPPDMDLNVSDVYF